jgi:hypothetical protein
MFRGWNGGARRHINSLHFHICLVSVGFKGCLTGQKLFHNCKCESSWHPIGENAHFPQLSPSWSEPGSREVFRQNPFLQVIISFISRALVWLECWSWGWLCSIQLIFGAEFQLTGSGGKWTSLYFRGAAGCALDGFQGSSGSPSLFSGQETLGKALQYDF